MVALVSGCWPALGEDWGGRFISWDLREREGRSDQTMMFLVMSFERTGLGGMW